MLSRFLLFAAIVLVVGCGSSSGGSLDEAAKSPAVSQSAPDSSLLAKKGALPDPPQKPASSGGELASNFSIRQVIRTAQLELRVPKVDQAERKVERIAASFGGYVENSTSSELSTEKPTMQLTVRVPSARFSAFIEGMEGLGVRLSKSQGTDDVTGQLVDLDARLRTLSAQEEALRQLLRASRRLADMIELHDRLSQVRNEIEQIAGQKKSVSSAAAMSSVTVSLTQDAIPHAKAPDPHWLPQVWAESTSQFGQLVRVCASALVYAGVFSPFWIPILLGLVWYRRSHRVTRA